ncbi:hypothetical protein HJC23_009751 [Cyclotella cryptica]|uniref:Dephospho-CoA kinase n=1 Tax=Cyclotella cryptica TaxID=29204 RepID=A0ABD3PNG8_9STRA|eukprot:CCRYP_012903-RA/>CCRYP_012903-RA protein AED:0.05 eAED:0.05 QI:377/1/1/1/0.66/0.5/4/17/322
MHFEDMLRLAILKPIFLLSPLGTLSLTPTLSFAFLVNPHSRQGLRTQLHTQQGKVHERRVETSILNSAFVAMGEPESETENNHNDMKILGVCGGIGSGKSTACKLMVDSLGCVDRIDADALAHGVYEPGSQSWKDIISEFGEDILCQTNSYADASIDRKKLGSIVFSDTKAMSRLEQIVWPHVRARIEDRIKEIKEQHRVESKNHDESFSNSKSNNIIVVEAALLLETDWYDLFDGIWFIRSSPSVAVRRLTETRGLTVEEAMARISAQQNRRGTGSGDKTDKSLHDIERGTVTAVITNDGSLLDLRNALDGALNNPASFIK